MDRNALVSLSNASDFIRIEIFNAEYRRNYCYVSTQTLANWFFDVDQYNLVVRDRPAFIEFRRRDNRILIDVVCFGKYDYSVIVQSDVIFDVLNGRSHKVVSYAYPSQKAKVVITESAQRKIVGFDKRYRRALSKILRDRFYWPNRTVTICADWSRDFYFTDDEGMCGGINAFESNGKIVYTVNT